MQNIEKILSECNENNTKEVIETLKTIVDRVNEDDKIYGDFSVRIGNAHVYIKENENSKLYETTQWGNFYLNFNKKDYFFVADHTCHFISYFDSVGRLVHSKSINGNDILHIQLFDDAYQRICDKLKEIVAYNNKTYKNNENILKVVDSM
jgi:hypothetical protein